MRAIENLTDNDIVFGRFFGKHFAARVVLNLAYADNLRELHLRVSEPICIAGVKATNFAMWVDGAGRMLSLDGERVVGEITSSKPGGAAAVQRPHYGPYVYQMMPPAPHGLSAWFKDARIFVFTAFMSGFLLLVGFVALLFLHGCHILH